MKTTTKNMDGGAEKRTSKRTVGNKNNKGAAAPEPAAPPAPPAPPVPVAEGPSGEPEAGASPRPVQPELPAQPERAETSGGADAAETSGDPEPGEVVPPVAEAPSGAPERAAGETSDGTDASPAQPSAESKAAEPETTPSENAPAPKRARAPKAKAPPAAPAPAQPAASVPVPAWRSSPARILRSALSPLDPQWCDWEKLESQIPGVREARTLLQTAYETATRLEKAAASGKPATRKVEQGALVKVRAKHAKLYEGVLGAGEVLRVDAVPGTHAHCKTNRGAGERATLPVAHLEVAEVAA